MKEAILNLECDTGNKTTG